MTKTATIIDTRSYDTRIQHDVTVIVVMSLTGQTKILTLARAVNTPKIATLLAVDLDTTQVVSFERVVHSSGLLNHADSLGKWR